MKTMYSNEASVQMLIALLKKHGIRRIVVSPGATNVTFVASVQTDSWFKLYSSVDERSAAYIACGLAAESGEPVALSCTGATASRNYVPGLTEAFYRGLPVLAITSSQHIGRTGRGFPQMLDRTHLMNDLVKLSVTIGSISSEEDAWAANLSINEALLELTHRTPGPVHINLVTDFSMSFDQDALPDEKKISRYSYQSAFPPMPEGRIAVFVGSHIPFNEDQTQTLDDFCLRHNAVVFCDQTSNYRGKYRVLANLLTDQDFLHSPLCQVDLLIHIGSISGSYMGVTPKQVWRVSTDGKLLDPFKKLSAVFEIDELTFFQKYAGKAEESKHEDSFLDEISEKMQALRKKIPELPFSNAWCAQQSSSQLPEGSALHLGILNTLRVWNYFETPSSVTCWSNTGGFGIDGGTSSLLGASLLNPQKLYFGISGDLAFFYDMNAMGNRHVSPNIRIMVINNGKGVEFKNYSHAAATLGESVDPFIAASGHFAQQSRQLLKHFSEDLGFKYLSASTKEEFLSSASLFFDPQPLDRPVLFEVFTDEAMESQALRDLRAIERSNTTYVKSKTKGVVKEILGEKGVRTAKKLIGR